MADVVVNYLAVLVSALVSMCIGALWYSPILFGNIWMRYMGLSKNNLDKAKQKGMAGSYLIMFISLLLMAYVLAHFVNYAGANSFVLGMQTGFWVWLGFIATIMIGGVLWEGKSWNLYWINVLHYLVILLVMGGILAVWQ